MKKVILITFAVVSMTASGISQVTKTIGHKTLENFSHYNINEAFLYTMLTQDSAAKAINFDYYASLISHWETGEEGVEHFIITLGRNGEKCLNCFHYFYEKTVGNDTITFKHHSTRMNNTETGLVILFHMLDKDGVKVNFIKFFIADDRITAVHMLEYP